MKPKELTVWFCDKDDRPIIVVERCHCEHHEGNDGMGGYKCGLEPRVFKSPTNGEPLVNYNVACDAIQCKCKLTPMEEAE